MLLPKRYMRALLGASASFDAGRWGPYSGSFCTIINCRAASRAIARPTNVEKYCAPQLGAGHRKFSSPTIIARKQGVGIDLSTG